MTLIYDKATHIKIKSRTAVACNGFHSGLTARLPEHITVGLHLKQNKIEMRLLQSVKHIYKSLLLRLGTFCTTRPVETAIGGKPYTSYFGRYRRILSNRRHPTDYQKYKRNHGCRHYIKSGSHDIDNAVFIRSHG